MMMMMMMAPNLRLPSQPQGITASLSVPNYTAWCTPGFRYSRVCEPFVQGCYVKVERPGLELAIFQSRKSNALTITAPGQLFYVTK